MTIQIGLSAINYGEEEIAEVLESLRSGRLTMGEKCRSFEVAFAARQSARHAIFVNSGSSSNLLVWFTLADPRSPIVTNGFSPGFEVIVPAVSWSTTIWPIVQAGGVPVLVDCDPASLTLSIEAVEAAIGPDTVAICPVHPLGNVCDMDALMAICQRHGLILVEDACEALGSRYREREAGRFGLMGTYSFYFSHHMTTIEGGMIVTDDDDVAELLRIQRAHGWSRKPQVDRDIPFDRRFHIVGLGFNLRPTELNAAFGLHQLGRLEGFNNSRRTTNLSLRQALAEQFAKGRLRPMAISDHVDAALFGFPVLCREIDERNRLVDYLDANGIETRPIICGNMARQPAMAQVRHRVSGKLSGADEIMDRGLYWGLHPGFGDAEIKFIAEKIGMFPWV